MSRPLAPQKQTSALHRPTRSITTTTTQQHGLPAITPGSRIAQRGSALRPPSTLFATPRTNTISPSTSSTTSSQGPIPLILAPSTASQTLHPTNISLYLTSLRLLDLHRASDWPHITLRILSSAGDLKERIKAVEWSLYHLFQIWEADEARYKLQPFFPPLEPLQSLNLRAALFRCLTELKKNGVLGREVVLRKTMLDDCKGDKFWEVLVGFSAAVLKRVKQGDMQMAGVRVRGVTNTRQKMKTLAQKRGSIGMNIAMAASLNGVQQTSMLPLAIAHRAELARLLMRKNQQTIKFTSFNAMIATKEMELRTRQKACTQGPVARHVTHEQDTILERIRANWTGTSAWPEAMLDGDARQSDDEPFQRSFGEVWHIMVEDGKAQPPTDRELGLVAELEGRVQAQRARLENWKNWKQRMLRLMATTTTGPAITGNKDRRKPFVFDQHISLQLNRGAPASSQRSSLHASQDAANVYTSIISEMKSDLTKPSKKAARESDANFLDLSVDRRSSSTRRAPSQNKSTEALRKNFEPSQSMSTAPNPLVPPNRFLPKRMFSPANLFSPLRNVPPTERIDVDEAADGDVSLSDVFSGLGTLKLEDKGSLATETSQPREPVAHVMQEEATNLDEGHAPRRTESRIEPQTHRTQSHQPLINGQEKEELTIPPLEMSAKMPPPASLTLAERTRLSMLPPSKPRLKRNDSSDPTTTSTPCATPVSAPPPSAESTESRRDTLLERTRQSMAFMTQSIPVQGDPLRSETQSKRGPRLSVNGNELIGTNHNRSSLQVKKQRQSIIYPVNQFDSPPPRPSQQQANPLPLHSFDEVDECDMSEINEPSISPTEDSSDVSPALHTAADLAKNTLAQSIRRIATPTEKLYAVDADVASVFRSRPRILASPVLTPLRDVDDGDVNYLDDGEQMGSPLGYRY